MFGKSQAIYLCLSGPSSVDVKKNLPCLNTEEEEEELDGATQPRGMNETPDSC